MFSRKSRSKYLTDTIDFNKHDIDIFINDAGDINPHDYNTHSFRIGSATHLSMNGFTEEDIKTKGRWKSASFQRYIHIESI
jgi:hypothetical protein